MKKSLTILLTLALFMFSSCKKETDTPVVLMETPDVPTEYNFVDEDGNSTVSFNGQAQRLEMLSEMSNYMSEANNAGMEVDGEVLKGMYANNDFNWEDTSSLGMTGSSKQLKSKTAAAPSGIADPAIQLQFENWMDEMAVLSSSTIDGANDGGPGQGGVVQSSTDTSKKYLQNAEGQEYKQLVEKGLMGAVFYNQITMNYLGEAEMSSDNTNAVDPENDKYYTEMEHAWDEAYGYFTTATDFSAGGNGTDRFWGKYTDGREEILGSASIISLAFRTGRLAITQNDHAARDEQIAIIRHELEKAVAGTAIHYLNGAVDDFADDALRNHQLSEAVAFIGCLPYGHSAIANITAVEAWYDIIGTDFYSVSTQDLLQVRNEIADVAGLTSLREQL